MLDRILKTWVLLLLVLAASCAQTVPESSLDDALADHQNVELVRAKSPPASDQLLDVAIKIFEVEGSKRDRSLVGDWVFQEILDIERQYLPTVLRETLVKSNQWGVVRVLPQQDLSMDLMVSATILRSDGVLIELSVQASDSTGRQWLSQNYSAPYVPGLDDQQEDPFQQLYDAIANDLLRVRETLSMRELQRINQVTDIRHAADLSPETFSDLLDMDQNGLIRVTRRLAANDPTLGRIERMRFRHNVFVDTLDDYYQELNRDMRPVYDLWRYYSREQILEIENEQRGDAGKDRNSSGFTAISNNYYRYKANKLFEQEWIELAKGFTQELKPQILKLNNQVYSLSGSVEDQYVQWRKILKQFYIQERGL